MSLCDQHSFAQTVGDQDSLEQFVLTKLYCLFCKNKDELQESGVFTLGPSWMHFVPPRSPILLVYKLMKVHFAWLKMRACYTHALKMLCKCKVLLT